MTRPTGHALVLLITLLSALLACKKGGSSLTKERCEKAAKRAFGMKVRSGQMTRIQQLGAEAGTVRGCEVEPDNEDRIRYIECLENAANGGAVGRCQDEWQATQMKR